MFMDSFKYYKAKSSTPDLSEVIDFDRPEVIDSVDTAQFSLTHDNRQPLGMLPTSSWSCWTLNAHPGIVVVRNAFTTLGQRYWIARCLRDFPRMPNVVNLNPSHYKLDVIEDWWRALQTYNIDSEMDKEKNALQRRLKNGLRWATLGYHHDWDTKVYSETKRTDFPADLGEICKYLSDALGFEQFSAQAAIVNYYPLGTTLAPHTDHSEIDLQAPLISLSFGQTAIFLIGGETKEVKPTALFLKSGDILVMSKASRLCYHAVPRIMNTWNIETWNIKVAHEETENISSQRTCAVDTTLFRQVANEEFWQPFSAYLHDARINLNVRQVLPKGAHCLIE